MPALKASGEGLRHGNGEYRSRNNDELYEIDGGIDIAQGIKIRSTRWSM